MNKHEYAGEFITFEGIDGCGKSSQITRFIENLNATDIVVGRDVAVGREPGATPLCAKLRHVLLSKDEEQWCYPSETLLFFADRVQHLNERVFPVLKAGGIYISDRYIDSTFAYQGLRGYNLSFIKSLIQVLDIPAPDITFWIKLDPEIAYARAQARAEQNLYDAKPLLFYQQLEEMYRRNFEHDPRVATIDASGSVEEVAERVWAEYGRRKKLRRCCF